MAKSSGSENTAVHSDTLQTWLQLKQHELWLKIPVHVHTTIYHLFIIHLLHM